MLNPSQYEETEVATFMKLSQDEKAVIKVLGGPTWRWSGGMRTAAGLKHS